MNVRAQVTIEFHVEGVGSFVLSLDEETMTFALYCSARNVDIPEDLCQWDACEPDQRVFAKKVVRCIYNGKRVARDMIASDIDRVHRLLNVLLDTALPEE